MANRINVKDTCPEENVVSGRERNCCDDEKFLPTVIIAKILIIFWGFSNKLREGRQF